MAIIGTAHELAIIGAAHLTNTMYQSTVRNRLCAIAFGYQVFVCLQTHFLLGNRDGEWRRNVRVLSDPIEKMINCKTGVNQVICSFYLMIPISKH